MTLGTPRFRSAATPPEGHKLGTPWSSFAEGRWQAEQRKKNKKDKRKFHLACDLNDTLDADPKTLGFICAAIVAAGGKVTILTGDQNAKRVLKSLNLKRGVHFTDVVILPRDDDTPELKAARKAAWCRKHNASFLLDDSTQNVQSVGDVCSAALFFQKVKE